MLKKKSLSVFIEEEIEFKTLIFVISFTKGIHWNRCYILLVICFFFGKQEIHISTRIVRNVLKENQIEFDITLKESHWFLLVSWLFGWLEQQSSATNCILSFPNALQNMSFFVVHCIFAVDRRAWIVDDLSCCCCCWRQMLHPYPKSSCSWSMLKFGK